VRTFVTDCDQLYRAVALKIVNEKSRSGYEIAESTGRPIVIVDHILREMWNSGRIRAMEATGDLLYIHEATPELKRWLRET